VPDPTRHTEVPSAPDGLGPKVDALNDSAHGQSGCGAVVAACQGWTVAPESSARFSRTGTVAPFRIRSETEPT
jgi:hypothetical protein